METPVTTSAAPAAASTASVSTSTPSTSVSSPAAASTSTAATSTPTSPATTPLSSEDTVNAMVAAATEKGFGKPASEIAAEAAKPAEVTPAAEPVKKDETTAGSAKKDDDDVPSYSLEEDGFVGAKDIAAKIDSIDLLKTAMPKELRDEIMANARIAEQLVPYRELFASPEEAKVVVRTAEEFAGYSEAFSSIGKDVEKGTTALVNKLIEGSALLDAEGNPMKNSDGSIRTDGTAGKFLSKIFERGLALNVINKVKALNDPNVEAALDLVMESVGLRASTATETENEDPSIAAERAALKAERDQLNTERETRHREATTAYNQALETGLTSVWESERDAILSAASALTSFEREAVQAKLEAAVVSERKRNLAYKQDLRILQQQPMTADRRQREVALAKKFLRQNLGRIAKPIFAEAGITVGAKAAERTAAQAARAENARSEVSGGTQSTVQNQNPAGSYEQQRSAVIADLKAKNGGKEPSDSEVSIALMIAAAERKGFKNAA